MRKLDSNTDSSGAMQPGRLINSIPQSQERLGGLSRSTIYELIYQGELEVLKIGRRTFITEESLKNFIQQKLGRS
jgi:excisionase family DNA binding protein